MYGVEALNMFIQKKESKPKSFSAVLATSFILGVLKRGPDFRSCWTKSLDCLRLRSPEPSNSWIVGSDKSSVAESLDKSLDPSSIKHPRDFEVMGLLPPIFFTSLC